MGKPFTGETNLLRIVTAVRELYEGRSHAVGTVTLVNNTTTFTVVTAPNCGLNSKVFLMPASANGAHEFANGVYISSVASGNFTIQHSNDTATANNRSFFWETRG